MEDKLVIGILNIIEDKLRELNIKLPSEEVSSMTEEIINAQLYSRVKQEYREFIEDLSKQSATEIIDASYEKIIKEDIVATFAEEQWASEIASVLMNTDNILDTLYGEWLSSDLSHMEYIRSCITSFADRINERDPIVGYHYAELHDLIKEYLDAANYKQEKYGYWDCKYNEIEGVTYVTCSDCGFERTVNGCHVNSYDEPLYHLEESFCPQCGTNMERTLELYNERITDKVICYGKKNGQLYILQEHFHNEGNYYSLSIIEDQAIDTSVKSIAFIIAEHNSSGYSISGSLDEILDEAKLSLEELEDLVVMGELPVLSQPEFKFFSSSTQENKHTVEPKKEYTK